MTETRSRTRTRQRLLDAALDVLAERSLSSTSVEAVCERAGFTRGAFYSNFTSIDDVVVALFGQRAGQLLAALGEHDESAIAPSAPGDLRAEVAAALAILPLDRTWYLLTLEMSAQAVRREGPAQLLADFRRRVREHLVTKLEGLVEHQGRRPTVPLDELAALVIAMLEGLLDRSYVDNVPGAPTADSTVDAISALLLGLSEEVAR